MRRVSFSGVAGPTSRARGPGLEESDRGGGAHLACAETRDDLFGELEQARRREGHLWEQRVRSEGGSCGDDSEELRRRRAGTRTRTAGSEVKVVDVCRGRACCHSCLPSRRANRDQCLSRLTSLSSVRESDGDDEILIPRGLSKRGPSTTLPTRLRPTKSGNELLEGLHLQRRTDGREGSVESETTTRWEDDVPTATWGAQSGDQEFGRAHTGPKRPWSARCRR